MPYPPTRMRAELDQHLLYDPRIDIPTFHDDGLCLLGICKSNSCNGEAQLNVGPRGSVIAMSNVFNEWNGVPL